MTSRINGIVRIIKNTYYVTLYYENTLKRKQSGPEVLGNIDDLIINKLNTQDILEGIYKGFIDLVTSIVTLLYLEFSQTQVADFKFVCCAYIDEIMYNKVGELKWSNYLMEQYFFGTRISGEKMMHRIIKFIDQHVQQDNDYGLIYYYIICTGYFGMYKQDVIKLNAIKKELAKIINTEFLFNDGNVVSEIASHLDALIIKTKHMDSIKNYSKIYIQVLFLSLSLLIAGISIVFYKGLIILKMFA